MSAEGGRGVRRRWGEGLAVRGWTCFKFQYSLNVYFYWKAANELSVGRRLAVLQYIASGKEFSSARGRWGWVGLVGRGGGEVFMFAKNGINLSRPLANQREITRQFRKFMCAY